MSLVCLLMSASAFKQITNAGPLALRHAIIRRIDDLLARYPDLTNNVTRTLTAFKIAEYCVEYKEMLNTQGRSSKRLRGVNLLLQQAQAEHRRLVALTRAQNNFNRLIHNPKFKKLGSVQNTQGQNAKTLHEDEVLEALDDMHRVGHALQKVHDEWQASASTQNFWDYLEGVASANENTARQLYHVTYLNENDRRAYEVRIRGGMLMQGEGPQEQPLDTADYAVNSPRAENIFGWGLFVMSLERKVYSGSSFSDPRTTANGHIDILGSGDILHHSSFLEGRPALCAGEWRVNNGFLECITPRSGHYRTPVKHFVEFLHYLAGRQVLLHQLVVGWPWPAFNDRRFYNAAQFVMADEIAVQEEPRRHGRGLPELVNYNTPQTYKFAPASASNGQAEPGQQNGQGSPANQVADNGEAPLYGNSPQEHDYSAYSSRIPIPDGVAGGQPSSNGFSPASSAPGNGHAAKKWPTVAPPKLKK